ALRGLPGSLSKAYGREIGVCVLFWSPFRSDACASGRGRLRVRALSQMCPKGWQFGSRSGRQRARRGARVVEWAGLANRCTLRGTVGPNPTPSARNAQRLPERKPPAGAGISGRLGPQESGALRTLLAARRALDVRLQSQ